LRGGTTHPGYAFAGSLLFGLHPIVTESVNWISGRTDLLMGFFLLLSTLFLIRYRFNERKVLPWLAALSFLCALLCKELAIAFLPGFFLILYARTQNQVDSTESTSSKRKKLILIAAVTLLVIGSFFLLRTVAFSSNSSRIGLTLQYIQINPEHSFFLFLRAVGFYLKKLLIPWPLNFAIVEVDPLYELAALPLIGICLYIAFKGTLTSAIFIAGLFLFSPALLIALNQIAWTPYAERYLYSTTAFVSIATVLWFSSSTVAQVKKGGAVLLAGFLVVAVVTTTQRNFTWQTNQRILEDTANKSRNFSNIQWLHGSALFEQGDYQEALNRSRRAVNLPGSPLYLNPLREITLGYVYLRLNRTSEAIAIFETVIKKTKDKIPEAHEGLIDCYSRLWEQATEQKQKQEYLDAMLSHGNRLYSLRPDPLVYYNLGKKAMAGKAFEQAGMLFDKAVLNMQEGHEYLPFARKLAKAFQQSN